MIDFLDPVNFTDLAEKEPKAICKAALCDYDADRKGYRLSVWGETYGVYPYEAKIYPIHDPNADMAVLLPLFVICYLLTVKPEDIRGEWISEKDVPGGPTFFRGPHQIPTHLIEKKYGDDINRFKQRCEQLNGSPIDMADAAYVFEITPRIPVAVQFWEGDSDFPPEAKLLYDRSIIRHLAPDIIFCLAVLICDRLAAD